MKICDVCMAIMVAVLFFPPRSMAHHGETNYDTEKLMSVKATVTEFRFINPHVQIFLDAKNDKDEIEKWTCEARSPAMLVRNGGWNKNTLKPGETITAIGFRAKNGTNILRLKKNCARGRKGTARPLGMVSMGRPQLGTAPLPKSFEAETL